MVVSFTERGENIRIISARVALLRFDGLLRNPEGFKPRFIGGLGYRVAAPQLPDLDFPTTVAVADETSAASVPDVIVGYSRGAGKNFTG